MNNDLMFSSKNQAWATRWENFNEWNKRFKFDIDVCATGDDAKLEHYYTPEDDGLSCVWNGIFWCNPPYGREYPAWINHGLKQQADGVFLIPARTDTAVFHDMLLPQQKRGYLDIEFIRGRLTFGSDDYWNWFWGQEFVDDGRGGLKKNSLYHKYGKMNPAPFPSMLIKCGDCRCL